MNKILDVNYPAISPPTPQFWGNWSSKSPRIGGFRGRSQIHAGGLIFVSCTTSMGAEVSCLYTNFGLNLIHDPKATVRTVLGGDSAVITKG